MPYNGSGVYTPPGADFPAVALTLIQSTKFNNVVNDLSSALSSVIVADGQRAASAALPMGGFRHTNVGNAGNRNEYASAGQVQDSTFNWCGTAGGTADALTLTTAPAITAYAAGQEFTFKSGAAANTGAATVAVSGLAVKAIQKDGAALAAGDIAISKWYRIVYDGAAFQLDEVISPTAFGKSLLIAATAAAVRTLLDTPTNAEAVLDTIFAAKGDLLGASANDTPAITTVGVNDTFLLADSAQASGLKWGSTNSFAEDTTPDSNADFVQTYDTSGAVTKKVLLGRAAGITLGTEQATITGTSIDFTGIPSWVRRITIMIEDVSTSGTSNIMLQIGDSGGIEATGYDSLQLGSSFTTGFGFASAVTAATSHDGVYTIEMKDSSDNTWVGHGFAIRSDDASTSSGMGIKSLSATLDRLRLTMVNGTDTFDAGSINIAYE